MMGQKLAQVAATYWTRPQFWILGGFATLTSAPLWISLFSVLLGQSAPRHFGMLTMFAALPAVVFAFISAEQTKQQFAHARGRLVPGFALPHLMVPMAGLLLSVLGFPLLVAVMSLHPALPLLCWVSCLVAALLWAIHFNSASAMFLTMGIGYSAGWSPAAAFWGLPVGKHSPESPIYLWPLLVGAWGVIGYWFVRLAMLHEEMDEYDLRSNLSMWDRSARVVRLEGRQIGILQRKRSWRLTSLFIDRWHDQIAHRTLQGTVTRSFLCRYGYLALPGWVYAFHIAFIFVAFLLIFQALGIFGLGQGGPRLHGRSIGLSYMMLQFSVLMPAIWSHQWLVKRWPRLGQELLAAHSREDWIDGLFGALLRGAMVSAAMMQLATFLLAAIWWPELISASSVVTYLLLVAGCVYLGAATAIWMASRYQTFISSLFMALLFMPLLGFFPLWIWLRKTLGDWPFLLTAVILLVAGWCVLRRARRSWLNVELGL